MASTLNFIKRCYNQQLIEPLSDKQIFQVDCIQRVGKQFLSIAISSCLIKSDVLASNRDISSALKKFEQGVVKKMRMNSKREVYRVLGRYCLQQLGFIQDYQFAELELAGMFFKELDNITKSKAEPTPGISYRRPIRREDRFLDFDKTATLQNFQSTQASRSTASTNSVRPSNIQAQVEKINFSKLYDRLESTQIKYQYNNQNQRTKNLSASKQEILLNLQKPQQSNPDEDNFNFELTQKDLENKINFSCEEYFIDVVGYLLTLPSPQGELTYIWQHLKWQGFETFYQPFMNEAMQWTCTARIVFPLNMAVQNAQKYMQRQMSCRNKRKARQMACMELLKSLYLQYPQVWMLYKHLKQQKRLVIAAVEQPKDQEEIALIKRRDGYKLSQEKIEKLFRHNKTDIRQKMEIISAKAELNTLLQQLPGRVTSPKMEKKPAQGNWSVPVRIEYKTYDDIQNNKAPKVYQKTVLFHNTKIAEQQAYMQAIIEMYQDNPDLFEKIQSIKLAKGIKQPQKKLPLMRVVKEMH